MSVGLAIFLTIVLILGNSYFSAAEMSLCTARRTKLQAALDDGTPGAEKAMALCGQADEVLATIQVYITLLAFFASAVAATTFSDPFASWMISLGMAPGIAGPLATILITLLVSYITIVVGELFPKRVGLSDPEGWSIRLAPSFLVFQKIATPLVKLTAASSNGLARIFGVGSAEDRQEVSEDEIRYIVAANEELIDDEKRMIHEIIDLGDTVAREIMTPRADMILAEDTETVKQVVERMRGTGNTRLPVYHEDYDRIVGVVSYKNLVPALMDDRDDDPVGDYAVEAFFVPETKDIFPLLSEMQTNRQQMAIVVDEYGGTDGLITVEDIVEEIVGEIVDETDLESKYLTPLSEDEWLVDGSLPVEDAIELDWPLEDSEEYETIAGWLLDTMDTIPQLGDEFEVDGYSFTIKSMRRRRVQTIRVKRLPMPASEDESSEDDDASDKGGKADKANKADKADKA